MSDYSHPSYNRTTTTNTTPSSHKHNIPPSNPTSQQQNTRPPYSSSMMNSISSGMFYSVCHSVYVPLRLNVLYLNGTTEITMLVVFHISRNDKINAYRERLGSDIS